MDVAHLRCMPQHRARMNTHQPTSHFPLLPYFRSFFSCPTSNHAAPALFPLVQRQCHQPSQHFLLTCLESPQPGHAQKLPPPTHAPSVYVGTSNMPRRTHVCSPFERQIAAVVASFIAFSSQLHEGGRGGPRTPARTAPRDTHTHSGSCNLVTVPPAQWVQKCMHACMCAWLHTRQQVLSVNPLLHRRSEARAPSGAGLPVL